MWGVVLLMQMLGIEIAFSVRAKVVVSLGLRKVVRRHGKWKT
jgi:hypothetical protein